MNSVYIGQLIVSGISSSFILLLTSLGLIIIMGYMKVVNLAHTSMLMVGAYLCSSLYQDAHGPLVLTLILSSL